jgi:hypothetical protein
VIDGSTPTSASSGIVNATVNNTTGAFTATMNLGPAGTLGVLWYSVQSQSYLAAWSATPTTSAGGGSGTTITMAAAMPSPFVTGNIVISGSFSTTGANAAALCWRNDGVLPVMNGSPDVVAVSTLTPTVFTGTVTIDNPGVAGVLYGLVNSQTAQTLFSGTPSTPSNTPVTTITVTDPAPFYVGTPLIKGNITGLFPTNPLKLQWAATQPALSSSSWVTATVVGSSVPTTFSANVPVANPGVAETMWYTVDGSTVNVGFNDTPTTAPTTSTLTATTIANQTIGVAFNAVVTSNYSMTLANMKYSEDSGATWTLASAAPGGAALSNGNETLTIGLLYSAAGAATFQVEDTTNSPALVSNNVGFVINSAPTQVPGMSFDGKADVGLDLSQAALTTNIGVQLAPGMTVSLDPAGTHQLGLNAAATKLVYSVSGAVVLSVDASGNLKTAGTMTGSTTP